VKKFEKNEKNEQKILSKIEFIKKLVVRKKMLSIKNNFKCIEF
jgi:hypothetical protein